MNGKIDVTSKLGEGTEFIVSIPLEVSSDIGALIDENEFDKELLEVDLKNYEFVVCNKDRSFGVNQIR